VAALNTAGFLLLFLRLLLLVLRGAVFPKKKPLPAAAAGALKVKEKPGAGAGGGDTTAMLMIDEEVDSVLSSDLHGGSGCWAASSSPKYQQPGMLSMEDMIKTIS
jgi:hypothetical protein